MTKRVRVRSPEVKTDTPSWVLEIRRDEHDPGGKYEFVRPEAAAEIVAEHNDRRRQAMPLPETHRLEVMEKPLSGRGWRITRSMVNHDEFLRRAMSR